MGFYKFLNDRFKIFLHTQKSSMKSISNKEEIVIFRIKKLMTNFGKVVLVRLLQNSVYLSSFIHWHNVVFNPKFNEIVTIQKRGEGYILNQNWYYHSSLRIERLYLVIIPIRSVSILLKRAPQKKDGSLQNFVIILKSRI